MSTYSWASNFYIPDVAAYRSIGGELSAALATVGMVQTADTGQIDWATVSLPASNTTGGYEVWRFNDTQQGSAPIFFKLNYGRSTGNTIRLTLTVGTGSNGSGTLTGITTTARICNTDNITGAAGGYPSYAAGGDGYLTLVYKYGSVGFGGFHISRTVDADGDPDAKGAFVFYGRSNTSQIAFMSCMRFEATAEVTVDGVSGYTTPNPGNRSSSMLPSGDVQAFLAFGAFPDVRPSIGAFGYINAEFMAMTTTAVALVGATARTYLALGTNFSLGQTLSAAWIYE